MRMLLKTMAGSIAGGVSAEPSRNGVAAGVGEGGKVEGLTAGTDAVGIVDWAGFEIEVRDRLA